MSDATTSGRFRVMADRCGTCVYRPGNLMSLRPGRLADLTAEASGRDSYVTCHETLDWDHPAACRGYLDAGHDPTVWQIACRLGAVEEVAPE